MNIAIRQESRIRAFFRWLLAIFYLGAGIMHIRSPGGFLAITPDWVPFPEQVVFLTGVAEIIGAIGLLIPLNINSKTRFWAGIGLAVYAVCVWPANINHAVNDIAINGETLGWGYHGPRQLLQPVFIWWALIAGGVINWPFRRRSIS
jgi:uncharacterized membrane protein